MKENTKEKIWKREELLARRMKEGISCFKCQQMHPLPFTCSILSGKIAQKKSSKILRPKTPKFPIGGGRKRSRIVFFELDKIRCLLLSVIRYKRRTEEEKKSFRRETSREYIVRFYNSSCIAKPISLHFTEQNS